MAITVEMQTQVTQLYVALFGRAPDGEGFGYWTNELNPAGGNKTVQEVANDMYNTFPARAYYPLSFTSDQIVTSFYLNVLGRAVDGPGLAYWSGQLDAPGATVGDVVYDMIWSVVNYAGVDPDALESQALFNNKVEVAFWYANNQGTVDGATVILNEVTSDHASVDAIISTPDLINGDTFILTTDNDDIDVTGIRTDLVRGSVSSIDGELGDSADTSTFNDGDVISGNNNTVVEVHVDDVSTEDPLVDGVTMSGVNVFNIVAGDQGEIWFDASEYGDDISKINLSGQDGLEVNIFDLHADLNVSISPDVSGTINISGSSTVDSYNLALELTQTTAGDAGETGSSIDVSAAGGVSFDLAEDAFGNVYLSQSDIDDDLVESVGDITIGNVDMFVMDSASAELSIENVANNTGGYGDATAGSISIGDVNATLAEDGEGFVYLEQWAEVNNSSGNLGDWGNAEVSDISVGNIDVDVARGGNFSMWITNSASAGTSSFQSIGNATVGDVTILDIDVTADEAAGIDGTEWAFWLEVNQTAFVYQSGDATVGSTSIGDITMFGEENVLGGFGVSVQQSADVDDAGDATVGDITVGEIDIQLGDGESNTSASVYLYFSNYATVSNTGDASVGSINIAVESTVSVIVGDEVDVYFYITNSADAGSNNSDDSAYVGQINVGDVDITGGLNSYLEFEVSASASGTSTASGDFVDDITIGDIDMQGGANAYLEFSLDVIAVYGDVGNVTVGDVTMAVGNNGSIYFSVDVDASGDNAGNIGDVDLGNLDFNLWSNVDLEWTISIDANSGDLASFTVGNVSIYGHEGADIINNSWVNFQVSASDDIGAIQIGDVSYTAEAYVKFSDEEWNFTADDGQIESIDVGNISLLADGTSASIWHSQYFSAEGDIGDVNVGDISVTASGTAAYAELNFEVYNSEDDIGDVEIGDVTLKVVGAGIGNASAILDMTFSATGDDIGTVTVGDIDMTLGNTASATQSAYGEFDFSADSDNGGSVELGNITLTAISDVSMDAWAGPNPLWNPSADVDAQFWVDSNDDITVGNITVIGGYQNASGVLMDNFNVLTDWLDLDEGSDAGDIVTVGNIDYEDYDNLDGITTIDLSGWFAEGGSNTIKAAQGDTEIYDTVDKNIITLYGGDDWVFLDEDAITNESIEANIDQIIGFKHLADRIEVNLDDSDVDFGNTSTNYADFLADAAGSILLGTDVYSSVVGSTTYVAFDADADGYINFAIKLTGVVNGPITAADFNIV